MKRKPPTIFVPTLLDTAGLRHIIPTKDAPAYCGAAGMQSFPHDWAVGELCARGAWRGMSRRCWTCD